MATKTYNAVWGQSIYDICLQVYGSLDLLYKLIQDSGVDSVNDSPFSGQQYVYDDALATDQALINKNILSGIIYATEIGVNGSVYYIIKQKNPRIIKPVVPGGPGVPVQPPPPIIEDMAVLQAEYVSNADGTVMFFPVDKDGISMAGRGISIIQIEHEIKPFKNVQYQWDPIAGKCSLLGGTTVDNTETLFILYSIPI